MTDDEAARGAHLAELRELREGGLEDQVTVFLYEAYSEVSDPEDYREDARKILDMVEGFVKKELEIDLWLGRAS